LSANLNFYPIPLKAGTPQTFSISLGGVNYQFTLRYRNDPAGLGGWVLDIDDQFGEELLYGVPLVTGANLLAQYSYLGFRGGLYVQTANDPDAVPTFRGLGVDTVLYWVQSS
jgi:hypothetical protein